MIRVLSALLQRAQVGGGRVPWGGRMGMLCDAGA